jgi:hypothetical protein
LVNLLSLLPQLVYHFSFTHWLLLEIATEFPNEISLFVWLVFLGKLEPLLAGLPNDHLIKSSLVIFEGLEDLRKFLIAALLWMWFGQASNHLVQMRLLRRWLKRLWQRSVTSSIELG